jgi:hypothetical protein
MRKSHRNRPLEIVILILISIFLVSTCSRNNDDYQNNKTQEKTQNSKPGETTKLDSQKKSLFECDYLGQELPGDIPLKFAPGIVSTDDDDSMFEISASGKEIVFSREMKIYVIKKDQNGVWSSPSPLSFSGGETSFSKDGKKIYFNSRENFPGVKVPLNVWVTQKSNDRWDKPFPLGDPVTNQTVHAPSAAGNGNIYASGIIRLKFIDGKYQPPEQLKPAIKGYHPFISADENFMIFDRRPMIEGNPADLYITFRNSDETWTEPVRLGDKINTSALETNAFVTPDG